MPQIDVSYWNEAIRSAVQQTYIDNTNETAMPTFEDVAHVVDRIVRATGWPRDKVADQVMTRAEEILNEVDPAKWDE